jgi:ABC-type Zn2+ transport system substrate-binding protein/surface adhesin
MSVCEVLDSDIAVFLQASLEKEIKEAKMEGCEILLVSGIEPSTRAVYYAIQNGNEPICRLLVEYGSDPSEEETFESNDEHADEHHHRTTAHRHFWLLHSRRT